MNYGKRLQEKLTSLFFIVFIISGCSQPNLSDYPTWYTENEQNQNNEVYYAKGIGDSKLAATYIALGEIAAQINLSISSNHTQETKRTVDDYSHDSTKRILVTTEDVKLNGYQILNEYQVETGSLWWKKMTYFVSLSVEKDKIIRNTTQEIIDLVQEINILSNQIESNCYQGNYELLEKKIKLLISNEKTLKSLNPMLENDNQIILDNAQKVLNYSKAKPYIIMKDNSSSKYESEISSFGTISNNAIEGKYFIIDIQDSIRTHSKMTALDRANKTKPVKVFLSKIDSEFSLYNCKDQLLYTGIVFGKGQSLISEKGSVDDSMRNLKRNFDTSNLNKNFKNLIK